MMYNKMSYIGTVLRRAEGIGGGRGGALAFDVIKARITFGLAIGLRFFTKEE